VLAVELPAETVRSLTDAVIADPSIQITVDLQELTVTGPGVRRPFEVDPYTRWRLLEGLDDIDLTLRHEDSVAAYEATRPSRLPSITAR
jgi:3-isopropylmalate/(R)-2-methylmalate dehydratase small subunit